MKPCDTTYVAGDEYIQKTRDVHTDFRHPYNMYHPHAWIIVKHANLLEYRI